MIRVILGSILSAILMFAWGFVVWGIVAATMSDKLGRFTPYQSLPQEVETSMLDAMKDSSSGMYLYPNPDFSTEEKKNETKQKAADGPFMIVAYSTQGEDNEMMTYGIGFAHMLFTAFLLGSLLRIAAPAIKSIGSRVSFVIAMGLTMTVFILGRDIIWYHQDIGHYFFLAVYYLGSFIMAGIVLGALIRPEDA
ncbi:MAG: hypothetical protein MPJ50_13955 [Pirellulales bacterium]|nr:hypothetical protein [Pirellulales bacterium]